MKIFKLISLLSILFFVQSIFSQNTVTYTSLSNTIDINSGVEGTVDVVVKCFGNSSNPVFLNATQACGTSDGIVSQSYTNGSILTPGQSTIIRFKFKKTVSADTQVAYKFSTNGSCFQDESKMIKITVNYKKSTIPTPSSCNYPGALNLTITNVTTNSVNLKWDNVPGAPSYRIYYAKDGLSGSIPSVGSPCCSASIKSLEPNTTYNLFILVDCGNFTSNKITQKIKFTTLCNKQVSSIENFSVTPYSYGYKINFTPIPNFSNGYYILEWTDLVTNGGGMSNFSKAPEGSYPDFYYVQSGHSFKIRLTAYLDCVTAYSNWVTVNGLCPSAPTDLYVYSNASSGSFNWGALANSQNYQGEYLIYNLAGQQISGTFTSSTNNYSTAINTNGISGNKFIKFRIKSQCSNGTWSDYSDWSGTGVWNN
ncbi:hypothetical protein GON26_11690 [Flavobacterium sp. GA093]|uniref:Fibronectin type-III domain-containing protein n=1 Tax=Flavobacterium hydrocarbonoxydans TaxID=2683249 RepID=A0A6I4NKV5_9FLAO|nr:fibronectin type III domain-containing protein [Flavobacterium hydrocarbonoxydans]MWB95030.1 hypothetical protein [Flavobacterium hydrocarbonoxydans]